METINQFYENLNIYYSLLIYYKTPPEALITELRNNDYTVAIVRDLRKLERLEMNHRMFAIQASKIDQLLFEKRNRIDEYTLWFCVDSESFEYTKNKLCEKKPDCIEKTFITKIFF